MIEAPVVALNAGSAISIIEEHWPLAADGTPQLPTEVDPPESFPLMTDEEWQVWQQVRAEDKAWQLANWDKWCQELDDLFG